MTEIAVENVYSGLGEKAQEVAPKIEELLKGMSIQEVVKLLYRIRFSIEKQTIVN